MESERLQYRASFCFCTVPVRMAVLASRPSLCASALWAYGSVALLFSPFLINGSGGFGDGNLISSHRQESWILDGLGDRSAQRQKFRSMAPRRFSALHADRWAPAPARLPDNAFWMWGASTSGSNFTLRKKRAEFQERRERCRSRGPQAYCRFLPHIFLLNEHSSDLSVLPFLHSTAT